MIKELFRTLFKIRSSPAEKVTDFTDAYDWILTYKKAEEYDTAIMAARELLLKIRTGHTYYTSAEKKIIVLASSNIETVAKAAKDKRKVVEHHIKHLHKWETQVRKLIDQCEELRKKKIEKENELRIEAEILAEIRTIKEYTDKGEIAQALHLAKKLAAAHIGSKQATDILMKTQKIHDKKVSVKEQNAQNTKKRMERFFREAGIKNVTEEKKEVAETDRKPTLKEQLVSLFQQFTKKRAEHREYVTRQKALRTIERMLLDSGSITKIKDDGSNDELFSIMESGLTKDINNFKIDGFDFFGKIIGKDKIVGDTFGSYKDGTRTVFYFGDATGHGVQAGFTVSLLNKLFFEHAKKVRDFVELFKTLNNELKAKLKGRVFVTGVFLEHDSISGQLRFIGAGHDPIYVYRKKTGDVEKVIPGGLALGVRHINNVSSIKIRDFQLDDGDILLGYTDGIIEARNAQNELYGLGRLENSFGKAGHGYEGDLNRLYEMMHKDAKEFMGNNVFMDDVSFFMFKRNPAKDLIASKSELDTLLQELDVSQRAVKIDYRGKTREEVIEAMRKERHERELRARMVALEQLYKLGEYGRLKQEITFCYKQGFVHERMKFFLEKILKNEDKTKLVKLEDRLQKKYEMLKELYEKGEYGIVIRETIDVLYKNGNI